MYVTFPSKTQQGIQNEVLTSLAETDGRIRIVFATSALEMGVNLPNIRRVLHYGIPSDTEEYVQEVGRGERDNQRFKAMMLYKSFDLAVCEEEMKNYVRNPANRCRRDYSCIFQGKKKADRLTIGHDCCDICTETCACGDEEMHNATSFQWNEIFFQLSHIIGLG